MLLDHHGKEDYGGALNIEERQGDAIGLGHLLLVLARNRDWHQEGHKEVGQPFVSQEGGEIGLKFAQKYPTDANLYNHRHKEKSRTILKAKNVDNGFGHEDHSKHEDCEKVVHGEHWSQGLPSSVVIGQDSLQHGTKGNGH